MERLEQHLGYLSATDGFRLLQAGLPIYIVSAPASTRAFPLDGAWKDDDGIVYFDKSVIVLNAETAHRIGRAYNQQTILYLYPCSDGNAEVYLMKDTPFAREVCLTYAGGYTADGENLLVAVNAERSPFLHDYTDWVSADMVFLPVR
jgi:hypothetical protein